MSWEEALLTFGGFILAVWMIPAVRPKADPPPLSTALVTTTVLWGYVAAMGSLGLETSAIATAAVSCMWTALVVKSARRLK